MVCSMIVVAMGMARITPLAAPTSRLGRYPEGRGDVAPKRKAEHARRQVE